MKEYRIPVFLHPREPHEEPIGVMIIPLEDWKPDEDVLAMGKLRLSEDVDDFIRIMIGTGAFVLNWKFTPGQRICIEMELVI